MTNRRDFLHLTAAAGTAMAWPGARRVVGPLDDAAGQAGSALRILILGGTGFIGPHQVRYALARGHTLTLFNRGRTNPDLFPEVESLIGDRDTGDLDALRGRDWDVVIDNSASRPRWVRDSAQLLAGHARQYLFVSTISVYADNSIVDMDESGPLLELDDPSPEGLENVQANYGALKVLCEREAERAFPGATTVIRPGLIVGPGDPTDRFSYWPVRIARGGDVLAPGDPTDPSQIVDGRDLSEWIVRMVEQGDSGIYNATGPAARLSIAELLYGVRAVTSQPVRFVWMDADFLASQQVRPWRDMPCWIPPREGMQGFHTVNCQSAIAKGLTFRPLADTALETLEWRRTLPEDLQPLRWGIAADREAEVIAAWRARNG